MTDACEDEIKYDVCGAVKKQAEREERPALYAVLQIPSYYLYIILFMLDDNNLRNLIPVRSPRDMKITA